MLWPVVLSLGVLSGTTLVDPHLGDYQWDTQPRPAFGAVAGISAGRFGADLRLWRSATVQRLDLPDGPVAPNVRSTSLEFIGRADLARWRGTKLAATAGAGRMHLGWQPDHLTVTSGGVTSEVALAPIDDWTGSAGVSIEREVAGPWTAGLSLDRTLFRLDTAHRSGSEVITRRESFGDWNVRLAFARTFALGKVRKGPPR
jgi:hypothetical protein